MPQLGEAADLWRQRTHLGAPGDSNVDTLQLALAETAQWVAARQERVGRSLLDLG